MSIMLHLSSLALKGAAQAAGDIIGISAAGAVAEEVAGFLVQRFVDQSQRLNKALARATDRAWRAVELALAGNSWWDRCKRTLASAEQRAFREQIQTFLKANPLDAVDGFGPDFRVQCHAQLQAARKAGLLKPTPPPPEQLARQVGSLARFGDPASRVKAEHKVVKMIAAQLRQHGYDALATFLELRPASGPPVLASAVHYFFQREVENDRELFQGLAYAQLDSLAQGQAAGFAALAEVLDQHGERLEAMLADVQAVVVQTRADVLDVKAELQRQGQQMQELGDAVLRALQQHHLEKRTLHTGDSLSIRDEDERRLVKDLVRRYRSLPAEQRQQMPALLNAVGKLEVVTGEFESAQRDFRQLAQMVPDSPARAEAAHNAYLAALERRAWDDALTELNEAARLDPARFAPFPTEKFEPERILGAGGFGVAFLCRNTRSGGRVVIKTLRSEGLDRGIGEVFREAQTLEELEHPAIIRIRDCDFADTGRSRPYLVMDYFQGQTLAEYVEQNGPLKVSAALPLARLAAEGLQRAHERGILHRDVKPANLLVRPSPLPSVGEGSGVRGGWEARLIDFGLAMRAKPKSSTMRSSLDSTLAGSSIAGTLEYAAPEQMGKLKGVAIGTYSDVYGFGKTCCFALFGTAQPTFQHWQQIPRELADLLGRCINEQPGARPRDFAAVLRELDRLMSIAAQSVQPRILEAQPVKTEPPRRVADVPERLPEVDEPRRRPRRAPRDRQPDEFEPLRRRSSAWWVVALAVGVPALMFVWLAFVCGGWLFRPGKSARTPGTSDPFAGGGIGFEAQGKRDPFQGLGRGSLPGTSGKTKGAGSRRSGLSAKGKGDPIAPNEFKEVLRKLQDKPSIEDLRDLAARLAATTPTEDQKKKREQTKQLRALARGGAGANPAVLEQAELADDILHVSKALNPLLRDSAPANKKAAALAMQKWGTEENVAELIANIDGVESGVFDMRLEIARAMAAIGDERAIPALTRRVMTSHYDRSRGMTSALAAFGAKAEAELRTYLKHESFVERNAAIDVLKEVGTAASIPDLEELANNKKDILSKRQARTAIEAIKAREKK
jgi:serine/threonine protein kinase